MSESKILTSQIYHVTYKGLNSDFEDTDDEDVLENLLDYLNLYAFKALSEVCNNLQVNESVSVSDIDNDELPYTVFVLRIA